VKHDDYLRSVGAEAIGGRLRRLSERIDRDAVALYKAQGVNFEQRWFGFVNQLRLHGPLSVTDIANALRISHASVSQSRKSLEDAGLIMSRPAPDDARRRLLELSEAGWALVEQLTPLWEADARAAVALVSEASGLMEALDQLEDALDRCSLTGRALVELDRANEPESQNRV
jgi:DNA-binding MarR family transcriptional regulator